MIDSRQNEIQALLALMKTTKDIRVYEHYQTIYFYLQGYS
ncbi:hypothetical protein SAMN04489735_10362 [Aneurinibacillus thermoaerophilus]|jgi:hypothetical protein|uniref:Uncharacterized protein n=1 Tax=Aneurinibacillus thermoaerophilus TaxID=143495 RepID=A0A1G8DS10_ANETH|nr:hypothetical protein SAMN04489735_10362 [Aneurinibacillus thermoaerophilus]